MPATVKDVAEAAQVSVGTVSRVLRGEPNVGDETSARVMQAVADLGYSRLRRQKQVTKDRQFLRKNIAILLLGMDRSLVNLPSVASGIHGVESALSAAGANILLSDMPYMDVIPKSIDSLNIHGLIIKGALQGNLIRSANKHLVERIREIPTVWFLGRPKGADWGDVVESNDTLIGQLAAEYLVSHGHLQLAILDPKPDQVTLSQRSSSFTWHALQLGAKVEMVCGESGGWSLPLKSICDIKLVDRLVGKLLKLRCKPTAIFCPADSITMMVYRSCVRRGIRVGKDISLISCNNEIPLLTGLYPEVTTIDICAEQIGRQAVEQLIWRISHRESPVVSVSVQPELVEGMSVKRLHRSK